MKYAEFMERVKEYYGDYARKPVEAFVIAYLRKDIAEDRLQYLFRYVTYSHPVNYGPPDIAAIEKSIKEARVESRPHDVRKKGVTNSVAFEQDKSVITDEEREAGVKAMELIMRDVVKMNKSRR